MIDGFAFFSLALHDHLKGKMKVAATAQSTGDSEQVVTNEMVMNELRRLWKNMRDTKRQEWQAQALSVPASFESSSHNDDDENDSQNSETSSFASKQSTERRSNASDERRSDPGSSVVAQGRSEDPEAERSHESQSSAASANEGKTAEKNIPEGNERGVEPQRRERKPQEERSVRPAESRQVQAERSRSKRAKRAPKQPIHAHTEPEGAHQTQALPQDAPSVPQTQPLLDGFAQPGRQTSTPQQDSQMLTQLMLANLQASNRASMQQPPMQSALQSHMMGSPQYFNQQSPFQPAQANQNALATLMGKAFLPTMLGGMSGGNSLLGSDAASMNRMTFMSNNMYGHQGASFPPQGGVNSVFGSFFPSPPMPPAHQQPMNSFLGLSPASTPDRFMGGSLPGMLNPRGPSWQSPPPGGREAEGSAATKRKHEMVEPSGITLDPEPPQVRTMTFVCDLLAPYEGQVDLEILSEDCRLVDSAPGIVGLSCQLQTGGGTRVIKRGQVKDARRHFAHQAQLRLSLLSSPNISLKVFSTGRLQIAGCRDEGSCMEAVKLVALAVNEIHKKRPEVMKRQTKTDGTRVEEPIDPEQLHAPQIVMINCSFDSGMAAVGSALDPHRLTELLNEMQQKSKAVEEVSYNPEQRYTGVKIKFKPNLDSASGEEDQATRDREVFIGMFPSGKAVITGAVRWQEVERSYAFAKSVLCGHFDLLRVALDETGRGSRKKPRGKAN